MKADWQKHERQVNKELSVDSTLVSGRFWGDKGDGATYEHPDDDSRFQLQVDEKCTTHKTYTVDVQYMNDCVRRAALEGKTFLLPIRYQLGEDDSDVFDYVVLRLADFKFMLGFDQLKTAKEKVADASKKLSDMKMTMSPLFDKLDAMTESDNLTTKQKLLIWTAVDAFNELMRTK